LERRRRIDGGAKSGDLARAHGERAAGIVTLGSILIALLLVLAAILSRFSWSDNHRTGH
jgi:hypothetical protein